MRIRFRSPVQSWMFSPLTVAFLSSIVGVVACLIPGSVYDLYLGEAKYVGGRAALYIVLCSLLFWIGFHFTCWSRRAATWYGDLNLLNPGKRTVKVINSSLVF